MCNITWFAWCALLCVHLKKQYQREIYYKSKAPKISLQERHEASGMLRAITAVSVARHSGVSRSIISRLQDMLVTTWSVADGRRSGRPRVTTAAEESGIRTTYLRNRFKSMSISVLEWSVAEVSRHTVGRRLRLDGIKCRRPCKFTRLNTTGKPMGSNDQINWTD